ncbi:tellurite resistance/C4-dicarboxylate transporter family protein [Enteractinococcus coprophilus]|uniref:Tellurite resistance protein TehA-like permease n=1 Tax=Enteractinococcus coprophilus TaxID=1027633 RepID=A0A543AML1_9MICC|nr:tellurite resistance/C4-dicarboxylate transporter family protein [Enteractinococcus coprophilus]TQL73822.1 tellurite resistance protein TehA-like permease [Enteractinococcus coprophilus]
MHTIGSDSSTASVTTKWWSPVDLTPGYFALVMGTGIVSVALHLCGYAVVSRLLLAITVVAYVVLVVLNLWRIIAYRSAVVSDVSDIARSFGFFTFVAGSGVIGSRLAMAGWWTAAAVLLIVAAVSWLFLGYIVPVVAVLGRAERPIIKGANGLWFVWIVGAQSVAMLSATLEPILAGAREILAITAVFAWSLGMILYVAVAMFVALRLMTFPLDPRDFNPTYWISMGALAITVVAAARIAEMASAPMVDATRGLVAGTAVLLWCFATWLIPALFGVGVWRHVIHRVPLRYEPSLWSIVFPLGMYSVAGIYLGRVNELPIVEAVGTAWLWVAVTAWAVTFVAMIRAILLRIIRRR